ncbi:hypothetical protein GGR57DRAFT_505163 [Xylariaceae sp. FL1272]|nr:hypothetical protein GGR57DRAFT_505163 [Xylariaceae sp. FL1272]
MTSQLQKPRSTVEALPVEICEQIIYDCGLSRKDLKSLRATCRTFNILTTELLFRVVALDSYFRDGTNLENIAATPHLARHVRELIWYEIDHYRYMFRTGLPSVRFVPSYGTDEDRDLAASVITGFSPEWFRSAVDRLPNLVTFRTSTSPQEFPSHGSRGRIGLYNIGLVLFFLSALRRPRSRISNLIVRGNTNICPFPFFLPGDIWAFNKLTNLELCVGGWLDPGDDISDGLRAFGTATHLERLTLCFNNGFHDLEHHYGEFLRSLEEVFSPPRLTSLTLVSYRLMRTDNRIPVLPLRDARSLRSLEYLDAILPLQEIVNLRNRTDLNLESITIQQNLRVVRQLAMGSAYESIGVTPDELLDFINKEPCDIPVTVYDFALLADELSPGSAESVVDVEHCSVYTTLGETRCSC